VQTPTPDWENLSGQQKSHAAVAGVPELFELLDEQIAAVDALGEFGDAFVPELQTLARHPDSHRALVGAINRNLKRLAEGGSARAKQALHTWASAD